MSTRDQILERMYIALILLAIFPLVIGGQLLWIQFKEGDALRESGYQQARSQVVLSAKRGDIVDSSGRALAVNTPRYEVALDPTFPGLESELDSFIVNLGELTGTSESRLKRRIERRSSPQYVRLLEITPAQRAEVASWDVPGLILEERFRRRYNYGQTAGHVLGHVDIDGVGRAGLELKYDEFLQGIPGRRSLLRDRRGYRRVDAEALVVPPRDGQTIVLTIDLIRQTILEEELVEGVKRAGAKRGSAIAVDPNTGAILAMANVPSFDPNRPQDTPVNAWRNSAITDRLEPGSSFKLVGATAAIELNLTHMNRIVNTGDGTLRLYGRTMSDTNPYGSIPFHDVIVRSSNVGMAKTAQLMQPGDLYRYARNYGFGQKTWIDLPGEIAGYLKKTDLWSRTTLTSMSIGYEIDVTPLQLVMAYAALANGGLLHQPYIVAERRDVTGRVLWQAALDPARKDSVRRVFDVQTARTLLPAFIDVVERGTARQAQMEQFAVAGKTGTARKVISGQYGGGYRATFVGFFPAENPRVAMVVVLDEPRTSIYGGAVSAPIFRRVAERWIGTLEDMSEPAESLPELPTDTETRPAVQIWAEEQWAELIESMEPVPENPRRVTLLLRDTPRTEEKARAIRATASGAPPDSMPDLLGLSARTAQYWLTGHGFKVRLEGHGRVVEQVPRPGAPSEPLVILRLQ